MIAKNADALISLISQIKENIVQNPAMNITENKPIENQNFPKQISNENNMWKLEN